MPDIPKLQKCVVKLLDGEEYTEIFNVDTTYGVILFDRVCSFIKVSEKDYFSLRYIHPKDKHSSWLNLRKTLKKQLKEGPYTFYFSVKFFPPDPCTLQEDDTRYLFVLAIRDLIFTGMLSCSKHYQLTLSSHIVQAEFGDWTHALARNDYLNGLLFVPNQDDEFEKRLVEYHKKNKGMSAEEAEVQFLKIAKDLDLYGMELHDVKDRSGANLVMCVSYRGLILFEESRESLKIFWPELVTASFSKKSLSCKILLPSGSTKTITYKTSSRGSAKRLYRSIVEFHTFFRRPLPLPPVSGLSLSSKFRYNGRRTYLQIQGAIPTSMNPTYDESNHHYQQHVHDSSHDPQLVYESEQEEQPLDVAYNDNLMQKKLKYTEKILTSAYTAKKQQLQQKNVEINQEECSLDEIRNLEVQDQQILEYETQIICARFDANGKMLPDTITYCVEPCDMGMYINVLHHPFESTPTYLI